MELIEYLHNQHYTTENYVVRKTQLPSEGDINLYGVRGAGKSTLVLDLLSSEEEVKILYIDLEDPNLTFSPLSLTQLQRYITQEQISLLILDHYPAGYLPAFPQVARKIIVSRIPLHDTTLTPLELFPLDYEEFLAFESSIFSTTTFNHFLRRGTLPAMAKIQKSTTITMKQFLQSHFDPKEQQLLILLAQHHTKHLTVNQIYSYAKEKFKLSKDWLYRTIKAFTQEGVLLFIDDHYQKSGKKMLLFDFAFAKYLTLGQPFITQFDTMVALTLLKHGIPFKTLGIHGYLTHTHTLIIPAPFESEESLWVKSQNKFSLYKRYGISHITIITVANSYEYTIEKIGFEALPFYEWTIVEDDNSV